VTPLRLMAVLAHPDDESLGVGGTLAKYSAEGVETSIVTATRGQRGRYRGHRDPPQHPGAEALGRIREAELRDAARALGVADLSVLDYQDGALDQADHGDAIAHITAHLRRRRPHVVLTFPPDGAYGHPDHIAISQLTTAAVVAAADASFTLPAAFGAAPPHAVAKLYFMAWPQAIWSAYAEAIAPPKSLVDGVERLATPWPDWAVTTVIDTRAHWETAWRAVACHQSQVAGYEQLRHLSPAAHEALWGVQSFYRAFSRVNGGRRRETDLFEGLRA
jgi:LmbE family N-acetylglucosaminyl deacetylase